MKCPEMNMEDLESKESDLHSIIIILIYILLINNMNTILIIAIP